MLELSLRFGFCESEMMKWPATDLDWWQAVLSIERNKELPEQPPQTKADVIAQIKKRFNVKD